MRALFDSNFTQFITLRLIKILYVVAMILIAVSWAFQWAWAFTAGYGAWFIVANVIMVPIISFAALIIARAALETIAVIFRIGENTSILAGTAQYENVPAQDYEGPDAQVWSGL